MRLKPLESQSGNSRALHEACQGLYRTAEDENDYVTSLLLAKNQKCLEKRIAYLEGELALLRKIGRAAYLAEKM